MSDSLPKNGYLDFLFSILKARQHPFILVEESSLRWMGLRVCPTEDLDLLIRDSEIEAIKADLLATGQFKLVEQNLKFRLDDVYTQQVPRLRLITDDNMFYDCINLWCERVYMLSVDGEKVQVPEPHAWNVVLKEEHFDIHHSWAYAASVGYTTRMADGIRILPKFCSQSAEIKDPIFIPSIPRMLDAQLDQARYRITHPENFELGTNRPRYHIRNFIRYLHLEKPTQREKVLPELAERNREEMEEILNNFQRKPLVTLASLQADELKKMASG